MFRKNFVLAGCFLLVSFLWPLFYPEEGDEMLHRNIDELLPALLLEDIRGLIFKLGIEMRKVLCI
jgi:hypothetical protein